MNESKEQLDELMNCGLSVEERNELQAGLQQLADTVPPRAVWQRIEQQARAEGLFAPRLGERAKWFVGAGMAAAVVLAVLNVPLAPVTDNDERPASRYRAMWKCLRTMTKCGP